MHRRTWLCQAWGPPRLDALASELDGDVLPEAGPEPALNEGDAAGVTGAHGSASDRLGAGPIGAANLTINREVPFPIDETSPALCFPCELHNRIYHHERSRPGCNHGP